MAVALLAVGIVSAFAQQAPAVQRADETVTIQSDAISGDRRTGVVTYLGNVTVVFDVTQIRADKVTIYLDSGEIETPVLLSLWLTSRLAPVVYFPSFEAADELVFPTRKGIAQGNVVLTDPVGTVRADRLEFNSTLRTGRAENVVVDVAGVSIKAREARFSPGRYELIDASGTSCPDIYHLSSRRVILRPSEKAVIEHPRFALGPLRLPALPTQTISLDQRVVGFRLPGIAYKRGEGLGIAWNSGALLDMNTALTAGFNIFPHAIPSYGIEIARSSVSPTKSSGLISPRSELSERFSYGYLENISVRGPDSEQRYLSGARNTISIGSYWNQGADSRLGSSRFTKPLDIAYERGGSMGAFSGVGQIRAQYIRERDGPYQARLIEQTAIGLKPIELVRGISSLVRLNVQGYANQNSLYGWARLQVGAEYEPSKQFRLAGAYVMAGEAGNPAFEVDRLYSFNAFHARADLDLGPTKISLLAKYDFERKKWYDREYSISQVMGCLEPFILYRQFPSDYRIGIRLRIDDFLDILSRREFKRPKGESAHHHAGH